MAENCSNLHEQWLYNNPTSTTAFGEGFWMSEAFARENEALTRALQVSLSHGCSTTTTPDSSLPPTPTLTPNPTFPIIKPEPTISASDSDSNVITRRVAPGPSGKITKRKSRASKRSPTTFIAADPANFRQMVQQVTGVRVGDSYIDAAITKPEPQRLGFSGDGRRVVIPQNCLPTLDTSAFLLSQELPVDNQQTDFVPLQNDFGFDGLFDFQKPSSSSTSFPSSSCFPTLESWSVM